MTSWPCSRLENCSPSFLMLAVSTSTRSTMPIISLPGSVSPSSRLPRRTNSSTPSSSSRSLMCLLTPDCEVKSEFATSVRLKFRRTVSRTMRSCWKFMGRDPDVDLWRKIAHRIMQKLTNDKKKSNFSEVTADMENIFLIETCGRLSPGRVDRLGKAGRSFQRARWAGGAEPRGAAQTGGQHHNTRAWCAVYPVLRFCYKGAAGFKARPTGQWFGLGL